MNLADVFTVVLIVLGLLAVFVGIWLATAGLFPARVERCADRLGATPWRCGWVGLATAVPLLVAGGAVGRVAPNAPGKLLGVVLIFATVLTALAGTTGLALRIGRGLAAEGDAREPWRRVRRGGVVLALTYGTIVLLPLTLLAGLGAWVLTMRSDPAGGDGRAAGEAKEAGATTA